MVLVDSDHTRVRQDFKDTATSRVGNCDIIQFKKLPIYISNKHDLPLKMYKTYTCHITEVLAFSIT